MRMLIGLLAILSMSSHPMLAAATPPVVPPATSPQAVKPIAIGATASASIVLRTSTGAETTLSAAMGGRAGIVIIFRGTWCPYCMKHLGTLAPLAAQLEANGQRLIAVTPESPERLAKAKNPPAGIALLSDAQAQLITGFGLAFQVDAKTQEQYRKYGLDFSALHPSGQAWLPVPAVLFLDRAGVVRLLHHEPDYTVRMNADLMTKAWREYSFLFR